MTLYKNKYRIESARCPKWDYTSNGYYFVTICTHERQHFFGEVINGEINISTIGKVVVTQWQKTEEIRPDVQLDAWVIMPNHFHGIVIIDKPAVEMIQTLEEETPQRVVSTKDNDGLTRSPSNSLGSIICQFKSVCTSNSHFGRRRIQIFLL